MQVDDEFEAALIYPLYYVCYLAVCCICSPSVSGETALDFAVGASVDKTSVAKGKKVRRAVNTARGVVVIELFALTWDFCTSSH